MRILFVSHRLPWPPDKGDKIRAFHFVRSLARDHAVDVAALADDPRDLDPERQRRLLEHCRRLDVVWRPKTRARAAALAFAVPSGAPASLPFFYSRRLAALVRARLFAGEYDAAIAHSAPMARYLPRVPGVVRIADFCDVDSEKWRQYADRSRLPARWLWAREAALLREFERTIARAFDGVVVASGPEAAIFRKVTTEGVLSVVPNGVDAEFFAPAGGSRDAATVLFVGAMDYRPNVEGVCWFHREVWPFVRASVPEARFVIVGPRPTSAVRALAAEDPATTVTGYVDDVRAELARATVAVAPLHIARGVQNKVLEAMAAGLPVVATTAAWEGVQSVPGRDLLVADEAAPFAAAVVGLLRSPGSRIALGENARATVLAHHSWEAHARTLEALLVSGRTALAREGTAA